MKKWSYEDTKKRVGFLLLIILIGIGIGLFLAGVTNASATTVTTTEQINITIVTVENNSVNTIMIGGLLYACSGGECVAYATFDYECPDCPTCPVVNFAALEANLTTTLESIFKAHNSTTLNEEDKTWLKKKLGGETIAGVKKEIEEVMDKTVVVKQNELNNLTKKNEGLQEEIFGLRNNVSTLVTENTRLADLIKGEEDKVEDLRFDRTLFMVIVAIILGVLMFSYLHQKGMLRGWETRVKQGSGGLTPEGKKIVAADERKKLADAAAEVALKEKAAEDAEERLRKIKEQPPPPSESGEEGK